MITYDATATHSPHDEPMRTELWADDDLLGIIDAGVRLNQRRHTVNVSAQPAASVSPEMRVDALLALLGIVPARKIVECKGARRRLGVEPSYTVILVSGVMLSATTLKTVFADACVFGDMIVVQMKAKGQ